jgi:hypothetical protein
MSAHILKSPTELTFWNRPTSIICHLRLYTEFIAFVIITGSLKLERVKNWFCSFDEDHHVSLKLNPNI